MDRQNETQALTKIEQEKNMTKKNWLDPDGRYSGNSHQRRFQKRSKKRTDWRKENRRKK
jgi:hypothetical protein